MTDPVDVAVVGLGAMGSMALWRLAERGARVTGVDCFDPPHERGSSHGESRIIRTAYAEGAFYVPLLHEAFALWRELETHSENALLTLTGAVMVGPRNGELVSGALQSARQHRLQHRLLDPGEARQRFPQHVLDNGDAMLWEPQAGVLRPETCIATALARAEALGATVARRTQVTAIEPAPDHVAIHLAGGGRIRAGHCIVAAGAWTGDLVPALKSGLQVERQVLAWFFVDDPDRFTPQRFPVFIHELPDGRLRYGLPSLDGATIKLAVHHEGTLADPDALDRVVSGDELAPLRDFATSRLRNVSSRIARTVVCMYTNTPDEHFVVGSPPGQPMLTVVGGCSGHSFKFAAVLGDVAADLALRGRTTRDIAAFAPGRATLSAAR